jgi:hypothetical protein
VSARCVLAGEVGANSVLCLIDEGTYLGEALVLHGI